jgi:hypothetical protein
MIKELEEIFNIYSEAFKLAYSGFSYKKLRSTHKDFNSQIDANAIYDIWGLRKSILKTHNYPKKLNPQPLLRKQDFRIEGNTDGESAYWDWEVLKRWGVKSIFLIEK